MVAALAGGDLVHGRGMEEAEIMSQDNTNLHETVIEEYAEAVRRHRQAEIDLEAATQERDAARNAMQAKWRDAIRPHIGPGPMNINPGVYRINKGPGRYAEALLIDPLHDYPDLMPMFR